MKNLFDSYYGLSFKTVCDKKKKKKKMTTPFKIKK